MTDLPKKEPEAVGRTELTLREFRSLGLLHEINRLLLHPLGLALAVDGPADEDDAFWDRTRFTVSVVDARRDPEGFRFDPSVISAELARAVAESYNARSSARGRKLGYVVQPSGAAIELLVGVVGPTDVITLEGGAVPGSPVAGVAVDCFVCATCAGCFAVKGCERAAVDETIARAMTGGKVCSCLSPVKEGAEQYRIDSVVIEDDGEVDS